MNYIYAAFTRHMKIKKKPSHALTTLVQHLNMQRKITIMG